MHKVTARWIGCSLIGRDDVVDLVEVDNLFYFYVAQDAINDELEDLWNQANDIAGVTLEQIRELNDPLGVLKVLDNRNPDWIYIAPKCECGSDTLSLPHSDWCPKYDL